MARNTEFSNAGSRFGETIRQSLDLISGRNVNNYTLLFLDPTKHIKRGESKNIVVPYIVLGRGAACQIQYGDEYSTVSRQHASIRSDDSGCVLIHNPEATNPTYVDGKPISGYQALQSGDEIQLSIDGPKIRFIVDRSVKTSTMGFTRRMSLALGQALRPYKRGLALLSIIAIALLTYSVWSTIAVGRLEKTHENLSQRLDESLDSLARQERILEELQAKGEENSAQYQDAVERLNGTKRYSASLQQQISAIRNKLNETEDRYHSEMETEYQRNNTESPRSGTEEEQWTSRSSASTDRNGVDAGANPAEDLSGLEKYIYYVQVEEIILDQDDPYNQLEPQQKTVELAMKWSGTGFLTKDGRFITARHVVQPWLYPRTECSFESVLNNFINDGGKVKIKFRATNSSDHTFTFTNEQIRTDNSKDDFREVTCKFSKRKSYKMGIYTPSTMATDWAYFDLGTTRSELTYNREMSGNLEKGETLYVLGYPLGLHLQSGLSETRLDPNFKGNIELEPVFSTVVVGQRGIKNGLINLTENSFVGGHSGGPVFAKRGDTYIAIGIVSAATDKIGYIVPISNMW